MSANIFYRQLLPDVKELNVNAPSWFMKCLREADMELPYTFSSKDLETLRGMSATCNSDKNPFKDLINTINELEVIEVWAVY